MARDTTFYEYVRDDLFIDIPGITSRAMFGGYGFYYNSRIFSIIADGKLYFKVGEGNKNDYESRGSKPFTYRGHNGKMYEMSYWELPPEIMEDHDLLIEWVEIAASQKKNSKS